MTYDDHDDTEYLNCEESSAYMGFGASQLSKYRVAGRGPEYVRKHGRIYYTIEAIEHWLKTRKTHRNQKEPPRNKTPKPLPKVTQTMDQGNMCQDCLFNTNKSTDPFRCWQWDSKLMPKYLINPQNVVDCIFYEPDFQSTQRESPCLVP